MLRRLLIAAVAAGVIAGVALGASLLFAHQAHPRFASSVRLVTEPVSCVDVAVSYGYSRDAAAPGPCSGSDSAIWFDLSVVNAEDHDGWVTACEVAGLDAAGGSVFRSPLELFRISSSPAGRWVGTGETLRVRWFTHVADSERAKPIPRGDVSTYSVECPFVDWGGTPPP